MTLLDFLTQIASYLPVCEQESAEKAAILTFAARFPDTVLARDNTIAHLTASGFIVNAARDKTLMIYHNLYRSWGWTGGHADGDSDLLRVALREAAEETGVCARPLAREIASIDILPVFAHQKRGRYVHPHLHLCVSYLLVADETQPLRHNPAENSGARWLPLAAIGAHCAEAHMLPVYEKLRRRVSHAQ